MAKYIDAERLRKEVKKNEKVAHKSALGCADSETRKFHEGKDFAYQYVGILIDSLQQEQPDCHTVEDWIQHIKNADQLTKDIFSKGPYNVLYDALNYPYRHCYDAIKEFGELCFQTGVNSIKQEQPSLSSNLDDAANKFAILYDQGTCDGIVQECFKAGANWQKEKDTRDMVMSDNRQFQKVYELGKKDHELTIKDLELLHTFLYAVKNNKQGAFTFTRLSDEQYNKVLRRFNDAKK